MNVVLPNTFVLGASKSGTSSLHYFLQQHPEVFMSKIKEPHFFDNNKMYNKGILFYSKKYFKGSEKCPIRGEATPSYFSNHVAVIPRILETYYYNNEIKFIIILRDPVQRAWSHYLHKIRNATENESFEKALLLEKARLKENHWVGYFTEGCYASHLQQWFNFFPPKSFYICFIEDLISDPEQFLFDLYNFLMISSDIKIDYQTKINTARVPRYIWLMKFLAKDSIFKKTTHIILPLTLRRKIRLSLRQWNLTSRPKQENLDPQLSLKLRQAYKDEITTLENMLSKNLSHWKP